MFLLDYNKIIIATFPKNSPIYFKEIRPLEFDGGQKDFTENMKLCERVWKEFVNCSRLN
jgi:hypothetical protein